MSSIRVNTSQNIQLEFELASLGDRILAFLLDWVVIIAYILTILIVSSGTGLTIFSGSSWMVILMLLPALFYYLVLEVSFNGQTIGKKARGIRVVSLDGNSATFGQYLIRWLFRLIDFTITEGLCGLLCVALNPNHQRLGDMVAGTAVIKTAVSTSLDETVYTPVENNYEVHFPEVVNLKANDIQLIKEVLLHYAHSGNLLMVYNTAEKIREVLKIQSEMDPYLFLHTLISDYNYLESRI
ncbi:MAG: RDD family protein [Chitinophagaceae bacterium]